MHHENRLHSMSILILSLTLSTQVAWARESNAGSPSSDPIPVVATPAERAIAQLELRVAGDATLAGVWTELALARVRRARETADPEHYDAAHRDLQSAEQAGANALTVQRARLAVLLGQHRFGEAAQLAETIVTPDTLDPTLLGSLLDAQVELGRYEEAWETLARMLAVSPGAPAVLARASYLVELSGDLDSAAELMARSLAATPRDQAEDRAWHLTHLAHLDRMRGRFAQAEAFLDRALEGFPDYHYAFAEQARLAEARGSELEVVAWLERRCAVAPHPECFFDLGVARLAAGDDKGAAADFRRFEPGARGEIESPDNANMELVRYYLDHASDASEALRISTLERSRRADVRTRTWHARALSRAGRYAEALSEIEAVAAVGTVDPEILRAAAVVEHESGAGVESLTPQTRSTAGGSEREGGHSTFLRRRLGDGFADLDVRFSPRVRTAVGLRADEVEPEFDETLLAITGEDEVVLSPHASLRLRPRDSMELLVDYAWAVSGDGARGTEETLAAGVFVGQEPGPFGSIRWRYVGTLPDGEGDAATQVVHASLGFGFRNGSRLVLDGFNLLDREDAESQSLYETVLPAAVSPVSVPDPVGDIDDPHFLPVVPQTFRLRWEHQF